MDLNCEGWVGDICKKFETVYLDVHNFVHELQEAESANSQVETACKSFKTFCVEVVKELLPQRSVDPAKGTGSKLSLEQNVDVGTYKKSRESIKDSINEEPPVHESRESIKEDSTNEKPPVPKALEIVPVSLENDVIESILNPSNKVIITESNGRSEDENEEQAECNGPVVESIEWFDNLKLGESCVFVDAKELGYISPMARKHKLLMDKLLPVMRSRKQRHYERMEIFDEEINNQKRAKSSKLFTFPLDLNKLPNHEFYYSDESCEPLNTLTRDLDLDLDLNKSPYHDSCESDWELL